MKKKNVPNEFMNLIIAVIAIYAFHLSAQAQCSAGVGAVFCPGSEVDLFNFEIYDSNNQTNCDEADKGYECPTSFGHTGTSNPGLPGNGALVSGGNPNDMVFYVENINTHAEDYFAFYFDINNDGVYDDVEVMPDGCKYINPCSPDGSLGGNNLHVPYSSGTNSLTGFGLPDYIDPSCSGYLNVRIINTASSTMSYCDGNNFSSAYSINDYTVPYSASGFGNAAATSIYVDFPNSSCVSTTYYPSERVMMRINIQTTLPPGGGCSVFENIVLTYSGDSNHDVADANLWSTGNDNSFTGIYGNAILVDPSVYVNSGQGGIVLNPGNWSLSAGDNYFWVTYTIYGNATNNNVTGARFSTGTCQSSDDLITIDGVDYFLGACTNQITQNSPITRTILTGGGCSTTFRVANMKTEALDHNNPDRKLTLFPNPIMEKLGLEYSPTNPCDVLISLTDIRGRLVSEIFHGAVAGFLELETQTNELAPGVYILKIQTEAETLSRKLIKLP